MITTPEIVCDLFSFLEKDQIERIQLVNQFWNNVIIRHKNILPLRQFFYLHFKFNQIHLYATKEDFCINLISYIINFDRTNLSKIKEKVSSRYSQLNVDEVLTNLNYVVFDTFCCDSEDENLLNLIKLVTTKTGGRFRGRHGDYYRGRFGSKLDEIFDNYIIVDELNLSQVYNSDYLLDSYIREVCANPEIVQLPSTPKEIRLQRLGFEENEKVLNFTCGRLNGANRLTIEFCFENLGKFIMQWFELYHTHKNPISLVGKFELRVNHRAQQKNVNDAVKTFFINTQLHVKYSLEEFHRSFHGFSQCLAPAHYRNLKRSYVLHETHSYVLVIEMEYRKLIDGINISSINASDLDQPPYGCYRMKMISFRVKSL